MKVTEIEPGQWYAVQCKNLGCYGSHPDVDADYEDLPLPLTGDDRRRWINDPRQRLHRCLVTSMRQPYGKTSQGVEVETDLKKIWRCTCQECGSEHPASAVRTQRKVVHPQHIECRWDQAGVWMASRSVHMNADDELREMT